jgi:hypothetical protein
MYNTKFVQNNAKASFNQTSETKHLNFTAVVIITAILVMAVALISSSIVAGVDAKPGSGGNPRDVCKAGQDCNCRNDTVNQLAICCSKDTSGISTCESCDIDTESGDYVNCDVAKPLDNSKTHGNPPTSGALGSQPQNPGNVMTFNPPNNAKTFVNNTSR